MKKKAQKVLSTAEVADLLNVSESRIQGLLRSWPRAALPPVGPGRRRVWEPEHVERLRQQVAELEGRAR